MWQLEGECGHRLRGLFTWSPGGDAVWVSLEDLALLEEYVTRDGF